MPETDSPKPKSNPDNKAAKEFFTTRLPSPKVQCAESNKL
jgi:hypothetical protein